MKDNKEKIIAIILVILVIVVLGINLFTNKSEKIDTSIKILEERNRFFEVSNCVDKYIKYVSLKDIDSIYTLFSAKYKEENNITKENIINYIPNLNGNFSFSATRIYKQQLNEKTFKYYVKGYYTQEIMDNFSPRIDFNVIVYMYPENMTFSIEPYNGDLFEEDL